MNRMPNGELERWQYVCEKFFPNRSDSKLPFSVQVTVFVSNKSVSNKSVYSTLFKKQKRRTVETFLDLEYFSFCGIHTHTNQNAQNYNYWQPATLTGGENKVSLFIQKEFCNFSTMPFIKCDIYKNNLCFCK